MSKLGTPTHSPPVWPFGKEESGLSSDGMFIIQRNVISLTPACTVLLADEFAHEDVMRSMGRNRSYWARLSNMPCHAMPVIEVLLERS